MVGDKRNLNCVRERLSKIEVPKINKVKKKDEKKPSYKVANNLSLTYESTDSVDAKRKLNIDVMMKEVLS